MARRHNQSGEGIVTVVIAAAILAIVASSIALTISYLRSTSKRGEGAGSCRLRAEKVIELFKNADNSHLIDNFHPTAANPSPTPGMVHPERYTRPEAQGTTKVNPSTTYSYQTIDSGTNWALFMYNSNPAYCSGSVTLTNGQKAGGIAIRSSGNSTAASGRGPGPFGGPNPNYSFGDPQLGLYPPGTPLPQETIVLGIQAQNLFGAGTPFCPPAPLTLLPSGVNNGNTPATQTQLVLTATVGYQNPDGLFQSCQASTTLRPEADTHPPSIMTNAGGTTIPASIQPVACQAGGPPSCQCSPTSKFCYGPDTASGTGRIYPLPTGTYYLCYNQGLEIGWIADEPGVVFLCDLEVSPPSQPAATAPGQYSSGGAPANAFYPCSNFSFTDPNFASSTITGRILNISNVTNRTGVLLDLQGLPQTNFTLFVVAVDSAQNPSSVFTGAPNGGTNYDSVSFAVNSTTPTVTSLTPPADQLIGPFGSGVMNHNAVAAPFNTVANATVFPGQYQCVQSTTEYFTATVTNGVMTPPGIIWTFNGVTSSCCTGTYTFASGTCTNPGTLTFVIPNNLTSRPQKLSAVACDPCGGTSAPVSYPWVFDLAPFTTNHSPTTLAASTWNAGTGPTYTFTTAKGGSPVPFLYACEDATTLTNYVAVPVPSTNPLTCTPANFTANPCTYQGSTGYCTTAFDACGRSQADTNTPYQIAAGLGQVCTQTPCQAGLICAIDGSANCGKCVATSAKCTSDAQCPGSGTCYVATGTCYGASVGPGTSAVVACGPTPPPAATPPVLPPSTPGPSATPPDCLTLATNAGFNDGTCVATSALCPASGKVLGTGAAFGCPGLAPVCCAKTCGDVGDVCANGPGIIVACEPPPPTVNGCGRCCPGLVGTAYCSTAPADPNCLSGSGCGKSDVAYKVCWPASTPPPTPTPTPQPCTGVCETGVQCSIDGGTNAGTFDCSGTNICCTGTTATCTPATKPSCTGYCPGGLNGIPRCCAPSAGGPWVCVCSGFNPC